MMEDQTDASAGSNLNMVFRSHVFSVFYLEPVIHCGLVEKRILRGYLGVQMANSCHI